MTSPLKPVLPFVNLRSSVPLRYSIYLLRAGWLRWLEETEARVSYDSGGLLVFQVVMLRFHLQV
jgi:hypothetical protein